MTTEKLKILAADLRRAQETHTPIGPIRDNFEQGDITSAYEIQLINNKVKEETGAKPVGNKIGLTSKKVQEQLGVDQPDFGVLFNNMKIENGGTLQWSEAMQPKVEAEIAFVLKEDLAHARPTIGVIANAIDYALVSIEIVGSRIKDWNINILDTVADNASSSHFVLGTTKKQLSELDLLNCKMEMQQNGQVVSQGQGSACLGSPLVAVQWLADKMVMMGNALKKGDVILSGALGPMATLHPGDKITATIEGLGEVSLNVSA